MANPPIFNLPPRGGSGSKQVMQKSLVPSVGWVLAVFPGWMHMAHLWTRDGNGWQAEKLPGVCFDFAAFSAPHAEEAKPGAPSVQPAQIVHADGGGLQAWALVVSPGSHIRVNGRMLVMGICVLADRDEIRANGGAQYFFSTEALAEVEPFPPQERTIFCGRCRQPIETGSPAVRCPGPSCSIWYHQSANFPCWTYDKCMICGQPSGLDAGFSWTPEA